MLTRTSENGFLLMVDLEPEELSAVRNALIDIMCNYLNEDSTDPAAVYWVLRFLLAEMAFDDRQLCRIVKGEQA